MHSLSEPITSKSQKIEKNNKKSQMYPINPYYTPKQPSRREESNGMLHDPIQSKESGILDQKVYP